MNFPILAAWLVFAPAAALVQSGPETGIPFARSEGISQWKVVADDRIYLQGPNGDWYLARTSNACPRMRSAMALGFDTAGTDRLDRFGAILAERWRCPIASLVRAPGPPPGWKRKGGRR